MISVDEPETGKRPTNDELDALVAIARQAAIALRIAQETATTVQHQRMLEGVLAVSARLAEADETDEVLQAVCDGIHDALEFDRVVIELADEQNSRLDPVASSGWGPDITSLTDGVSVDQLRPLFTDEFEIAGCYLIPTEVAEERLGRRTLAAPPLGAERARPARVGAPLATRAARRARGTAPRRDLGR